MSVMASLTGLVLLLSLMAFVSADTCCPSLSLQSGGMGDFYQVWTLTDMSRHTGTTSMIINQ